MNGPRLRAPLDDGQFLVYPEPRSVGPVIECNRLQLASSKPIFGRPLAEFRKQAIAEIVAAAQADHRANGEPIPDDVSDSLFLVGHQPDLFHPGVWLKNFAVGALAHRSGATALNLIVDCDTVKHTSIAVPVWNADPGQAHRISMAFDSLGPAAPFEERTVGDGGIFAEFANAVQTQTANWPQQPILVDYWAEVQRQRQRTAVVGEMFAVARRAIERRWGAHNLEVRLSTVCRTAAFGEFAGGIVAWLPAFHDAYNLAVQAYRRRHRIKNAQHPVPDLARDGDWLEAPFWAWRANSPRRERLFVRQVGGRFELRAGRQPWPDLPGNAGPTHWSTLERNGYKVRTRALTTTLFARLLVGDIFIHGIGGAKYDELTDELMRRFFGIEPPAIVVVTGTLQLPLPRFGGTIEELRAARRAVRDLDWNPQRHLPGANWAAHHAALRAQRPATKHDKRMQFAAFRAMIERMRPLVANDRMKAVLRMERMQQEVEANEILNARDYAFVLYSEEKLRSFVTKNVWTY